MQASELFPGAVVMWSGNVATVIAINIPFCGEDRGIRFQVPDYKIDCFPEALSPLRLSPAVLAGLGFEKDRFNIEWVNDACSVRFDSESNYFHTSYDNTPVLYAHCLQAVSWYVNGITLTWNQAAYEKAKTQTEKQ